MKIFFIISTIVVSALAHSGPEKPKVYQSVGEDFQANATIVPYKNKSHYLIYFDGLENKYDQAVMLYHKVKRKNDNRYEFKVVGNEKITHISSFFKWDVPYLKLTFSQHIPAITIRYDKNATPFQAEKVIERYNERQGLAISQVKAKKWVSNALKSYEKSCDQSLKLNIDWDVFKEADEKTTPGMTKAYINSLDKICQIDSDFKEAAQKIKSLTVKPAGSKAPSVQLNGDTLLIKLSRNQENLTENAYDQIFDLIYY